MLLKGGKYLLTGAVNGSVKILNLTNFQLETSRELTHEGKITNR